MSTSRSQLRGFTLIELMVTLSIAAVLGMIAVPSLVTYQRNAALTSATNTLFASINAARGEAMKRSMNVTVVPADGADWNSGWTVFVDSNRNQIYNAGSDILIQSQVALAAYLNVQGNGSATGSAPYILYDASGYSKLANGSPSALSLTLTRTDLAATPPPDQTRRIMIAVTGRPRTCKPITATDVNCAANTSG